MNNREQCWLRADTEREGQKGRKTEGQKGRRIGSGLREGTPHLRGDHALGRIEVPVKLGFDDVGDLGAQLRVADERRRSRLSIADTVDNQTKFVTGCLVSS